MMRSCATLRTWWVLVLVVAGCPDDPVTHDAGPADAGSIADAGPIADAGAMPTPGLAWSCDLPNTSFGSPRLFQAETGPELLLSFGASFGNPDPSAVLGGALSVRVEDGSIAWQIDRDEVLFTLAVPLDIGDDSKQVYLFGGKRGALMAVDAESGELLFQATPFGHGSRAAEIWNWYSGIQVRDINGDGVGEVVITNGGDDAAQVGDPRPQGWLVVLNGADLSIIHKLPVPNAAETYCTPTLWEQDGRQWVVYGTGGETLPGSFWGVPLDNLLAGNLNEQIELVGAGNSRGAIAPASYADLDNDGVLDLIANPFDGRVVVLSGADRSVLWQHPSADGRESAASSSIGDFDGDGDLDVFASVIQGVFPMWNGSEARAFDGRTGEILFEDNVPLQLIAGATVAADVDGDGKDEVLLARTTIGASQDEAQWSELQIFHVEEGRFEVIGEQEGMVASAGWVGDADGDGYLEWYLTLNSSGVSRLVRYNLAGRVPEHIAWGGYLGTRHNARY